MRAGLRVFLVWLAVLASGAGQNAPLTGGGLAGLELPPAPESRVLDVAGLLDRHPGHHEVFSQRLKLLEERHDLPAYLVIYSSLVVGDLSRRPRELYEAWIGEGHDGVVVVCEVDTRRLEIAFPLGGERELLEDEDFTTRLPDHLLIPVTSALKTELSGEERPLEFLDQLTATLVLELDEILREAEEADNRASTWQYVVITLAIGGMIGVLGYYGHCFANRAESRSREQFYFPRRNWVSTM